jgi:hypothetical protein
LLLWSKRFVDNVDAGGTIWAFVRELYKVGVEVNRTLRFVKAVRSVMWTM